MSCSAAPRLGRGQRGHRTNDTRRDGPILSVDLPICLLAFALILPLLERREEEAEAHIAHCRPFVHAFKFTHNHICMHCLSCVFALLCHFISFLFFPLLHRAPAPVSSHNVICVKVAPFSSLIAHLSFIFPLPNLYLCSPYPGLEKRMERGRETLQGIGGLIGGKRANSGSRRERGWGI